MELPSPGRDNAWSPGQAHHWIVLLKICEASLTRWSAAMPRNRGPGRTREPTCVQYMHELRTLLPQAAETLAQEAIKMS